jgi:SpoIID/LytB domain protein
MFLSPTTPATTVRIEALYPTPEGVTCPSKIPKPLRARYRGSLEIVRTTGGRLALINELTVAQYLQGLSEVPRSWPADALRAQVVAARSYAMYQLAHPTGHGEALGYDICSTDQCQVYRGVSVEEGAFGDAWVAAVAATAGQVLLYRGAPIQAFYFSTSSGRTRTNQEAFGGSPRPYLPSVSGEDADAPLASWSARVPLADMAVILRAAGHWSGASIGRVSMSGETVTVSGSGDRVTLSKATFRRALNAEAPCSLPDRYPGPSRTGGRMPQTVPSEAFSLSTTAGAVVMPGRGWGHGVGMSQFGARALAARGRSYRDILAHFYGGLRPTRRAEPGRIRVLVADGVSTLRVGVEGSASVTSGTGSSFGAAPAYEVTGGDEIAVRRGVGPSLAPVLSVTLASGRETGPVLPGAHVDVDYEISGPARVTLTVERDGVVVARTVEASQEKGANRAGIDLLGEAGPLAAGDYTAVVEAFDGIDRVRSPGVTLSVREPPPPPRPAPPAPSPPPLAAIGAVAALAVAALGLALLRRRRLSRR